MTEWRPAVGYEGLYSVSDKGEVRSDRTGRILSPTRMRSGHERVKLQSRPFLVHRLVCESFHGPAPEGKPFALHWDDDPSNNRVENLRWGSRAENTLDAVRNGRYSNGNDRKTACKYGHSLTGENTYRGRDGRRQCRICRRRRDRERR